MISLRNNLILPFLLLFFLGFLQPVYGFDAQSVARMVQEKYDTMTSIEANFQQSTSLSGLTSRAQKASGVVVIQKPGRLRWDYTKPHRQVLVCDNDEVSFYLERENQLIVSKASAYLAEDLTYAFFTGKGNLLTDFLLENAPENMAKPGSYCLRLTPKKSHAQVHHLFLWVDGKSFDLQRIRLVDHLDSVTDISFTNMVFGKKFEDSFFLFVPPKGTEIILQ
ncbi:MAG: outer membrane lipoprotein carrier protein LolA [Proteobacteria bacterium]|nr:outer membrane lipoprotein carrier protein LolA [Pseudomonadota bacterium]MBU1639573.1 outer membrane lipoprotein carrier protein LolA [Pseudomonadota bacterium]